MRPFSGLSEEKSAERAKLKKHNEKEKGQERG